MKDKRIKLSDYFKLVKPEYTYIQITPDKSIRNYDSVNIVKTISATWVALNKRIRIEQRKLFFETNFKISYIIDIKHNTANFYFQVPVPFLDRLIEKINEIWPRAKVDVVQGIEEFSKDSTVYQLNTKKEDALSLSVDRKSNEPLNSLLHVIDIMREDDRVTIIYNFLPRTQFGWLNEYEKTVKKLKARKPVDKEKFTLSYLGKNILIILIEFLDGFIEMFNDFTGGVKKTDSLSLAETLATALESSKELSNATKKKKEMKVIDAQIAVIGYSEDKTRNDNNIHSVCQSYRVLDEDNELIYKKVKDIPKLEEYMFKGIEVNTFSADECQNFIQVPGRSLLRQFNLPHIKVTENPVPKELRNGYICFGNVKCKGETYPAYVEDDYDKGSLPLVEVGSQGAGKSTFMANYYRFANSKKEGGVLIDFIKNCELTAEVLTYLPKEDVTLLDYTDEKCMQGFAFNEFQISDTTSVFKKIEMTNLQAQQVLTLVNSINPEQQLQARMRKYLSAAANIVFATGETSLKEVERCLDEHEVRKTYIDKLGAEEKELLQDELKYLGELDEYSKITKDNPIPEIIGTKNDRIDGILDRISLLKEDLKLKYMFNKGGKDNIDFAKELEQGKVIIIRMPQDSFKKHSKNIIVTFLLSKIWIATEIRGKWNKKPKPTHISIDEVFQTKTAMSMLASDEILPQTRKFGCKFILSCQYTEQIEILLDTLIGAGASFMFMRGTSENDYKRFENKLTEFEYEDLKDMENYSSMNLIYYSGGYASFISKLPPPIK